METKLCTICEITKPITAFKTKDGKLRRHTCSICMQKRYRVKLKLDMIQALGGICECCQETNPYFLTLDHRNNDGNIHREKLASHQCIAEARKENFPKEKYQLLCMNCNFAKGHYGICPHKANLDGKKIFELWQKYLQKSGKARQNYNSEANLTGLEKARAQLKLNRIERGELGKDQATRSREYRKRHPEYKERKKLHRATAAIKQMTEEEKQKLIQSVLGGTM